MQVHDTDTSLRLLAIFCISFALNFVWEHFHSVLYAHYQGGLITNAILFKATLGDALFTTALSIPFSRINYLQRNLWLIIPIGMFCAIALELFALSTGRWAYNDFMPLIPLLQTGLTPTIQLGLLGYISVRVVRFYNEYRNNAAK